MTQPTPPRAGPPGSAPHGAQLPGRAVRRVTDNPATLWELQLCCSVLELLQEELPKSRGADPTARGPRGRPGGAFPAGRAAVGGLRLTTVCPHVERIE
ncbi:NADH dehydrogenase [Streptomyces lydicamycinicus]|uniref:NADH dehydrogenase n=1 Tax=Streptomyces lydicamycinicus TaxID=1546107 RepID=A0A0P4R5P3_9ACTN|nr:NADH dehydrogenase [Streptomyces lydicamycinicus]